ncbi:MAG: hypothetical protein JWQ65_1919, partial [Devosia sp.]|nr:hypothetical protein [Devosia sp.]
MRNPADLKTVRRTIVEFQAALAALRGEMLLRKYRSTQPRVPAGSSEGGQWTDGAANSNAVFV